MKGLLIALLISSSITKSWAQLDWVKGGFTTDLVYVNQNHLISIGYDGLMLRSLNAGTSWSQVKLNTTQNLYAINFRDNDLGMIAGESSFFMTQDGGFTWNTIPNPFPNPRHLKIFNNLTWCISITDRLLKTTNGGISWDTIYQVPSQNFVVNEVIYHNLDTMFLFLNHHSFQLRRTTTGGISWDSLSLNIQGQFTYRGISLVNGMDLNFAFNSGSIPGQYVARSSNFGNTWDIIRIPGNPSSVDRYVFLDTNIIYAHVGSQITRHNYNNLQVVSTTTFSMCRYRLKVYSPTHASTIGIGDIHNTQNNWSSFTGDTIRITEFHDVSYLANNKIIGFGKGTIEPVCFSIPNSIPSFDFLISNNSGESWTRRGDVFVSAPNQFHKYYSVANDSFVYYTLTTIAARYNFITNQLLTLNPIPYLGSFSQIQAFDGSIVYLSQSSSFSNPGGIFKSINKGQTWNQLINAPANIFQFVSPDTGYALKNPFLFQTTNGGSSWDTISTTLPPNSTNFYFHSALTGFIQSPDFSEVIRTSDGGMTWSPSLSLPGKTITRIRNINGVIFVLSIGSNSRWDIHYSFDLGVSWHTDPRLNNLSHQLHPAHINQAGELLLYGIYKSVFKIANFNNLLSIADEKLIEQKILIYPNPAGDAIRISGLSAENNLIQIFDLQGKLMLEQRINQSDESVNISQIPEGLYIVRAGARSAKLVVKP